MGIGDDEMGYIIDTVKVYSIGVICDTCFELVRLEKDLDFKPTKEEVDEALKNNGYIYEQTSERTSCAQCPKCQKRR